VSYWYHNECFNLPRKLSTGADKITVQEFIETHLRDDTDEQVLKTQQAAEIAEKIAQKKKRQDANPEAKHPSHIEKLRQAWKEREEKQGDEPDSKKAKTVDSQRLELFGKYTDLKNDDLDDILRWNHQFLKGTKDVKIAKCIDGELHGRLSNCSLCGGRLKLVEQPDGTEMVECNGKFDEDSQIRMQCDYKAKPEEAPRWQPW